MSPPNENLRFEKAQKNFLATKGNLMDWYNHFFYQLFGWENLWESDECHSLPLKGKHFWTYSVQTELLGFQKYTKVQCGLFGFMDPCWTSLALE